MQPGQLLNYRYRIEKKLAAGGFGETFVARDLDSPSQRRVVVKLLKPQSNDPATLQIAQRLFQQEASILERLGENNDRIPTLYAYFESGGEFYLVQEFIDGMTLTDELGGRKLSVSATIDLLKEILLGLELVHRQNIIHRDLKPDNIIRRARDGKLVLLDFGAVKQIRAAGTTTPVTVISQTIGIGTPGYMPTEQGMGYPKPASDIYAVGAIAIQCLTGSHPQLLFDEESLKLEWQHLCQVDRNIANVLERTIAPDYRQRYSNATEALKAIESLISPLQQQKVQPPPPPSPTPQPVIKKSPAPNPVKKPVRSIDRRNFLKWLGFGGAGMVSVVALSQIGKNSSTDKQTNESPSPSGDGKLPKLTTIQFTSVKLNSKGEVIDKPTGSAQIFIEDLGGGVELTMVKIPAGKFLMGSPENEQGRSTNESPQRQVSVPEFYLGQTEVTQAQWVAIMGNNPSSYEGNKLPVEQVSWLDAMDFCQKLSEKTGQTYRLPSEAQWEYAARAGTTTPFAFGETITPDLVNYNNGNYPHAGAAKDEYRTVTPVGTFPPNRFGLYDMHGNLWEWCLDEWVDNYNGAPTDGGARGDIRSRDKNKQRLLRGGSRYRYGLSSDCRSAYRNYIAASLRNIDFGLRVVSVPSRTS